MKKGTIVALIVVLGLVLLLMVAIVTRPPIEEPPTAPADPARSPLDNPLVNHMREAEGIDFGSSADHDVAIIEEAGNIRVVFSQRILEEWGPDAAIQLNLIEGERTLKRDQFDAFLRELHEFLVESEDHEHHEPESSGQ